MTAREIILDGGSPWGFRMHGGVDVLQPLRISRVNPGSKAAAKGIREGDIITSINGENTRDRTNSEAHALLKAAGNKLKLGLNQDCSGGSPKKRQYNNTNNKSVQQETHSETIKRSNTTTTTYIVNSSTTTTTSDTTTPKSSRVDFEYGGPKSLSNERIGFSKENNEYNGIRINGDSKSTGKDYFSDRSTISSNYSSAASTPSTLTEYQVGDERASPQDDPSSSTDIKDSTMADNARNSRSSSSKRRRRSNNDNNKRKGKERNDRDTVRPSTVPATDASADSERLCDSTRYRVESPKTVPQKTRKGSITKSRSLDDDDQVKIQELSESSESDEKSSRYRCGNAIVVEADSEEVEWEITADLVIGSIIPQHIRTMTTETLKLEEKIPPKIITPEDESNLRYFLEGLDLVTSPEEAARKTQERETAETIRARRAKKREELAQYFLPVYQNPRFLDVISEEGSDLSDREQREKKKTVLTETDSSRIPVITCTTTVTETSVSSDVEIVYLESSDSESDESADYADIEEESNDAIGSIPSSQLTPPPTPDDVSPKNGVVSSNSDFIRQTAALIVEEDYDALREVLKDDVRFKRLPGDLQRRIHQLNLVEDKEDIPKAPIQRINVVSPSILSECSGESSSRGTSLCTTIFKDEEGLVSQPLTLKEFCLNKLISLPFGKDVLEELASVSRSLQDLTNNLSSRKHVVDYYHHHNHHNHHSNNNQNNPRSPAFTTSAENRDILTPENVTSTNASFDLVSARKAMPERAKDNRDKWVGMPSEDDPQLVVCLSPTQKTFLETTKKIPDEAAKLLDLHEKFASRRQYHENIKDGDESEMTNRLLAIIRHAGNNSEIAATKTEDPDDYLYYVEKQSNQIRLPRSNSLEETPNDSARLKTHNLSEWLRLARDKSKSDPHLNIFNDSKEIVAINLPKTMNQTAKRRKSLPQEIYVQQMQYLIQKEKEIQQELEKLEEEKRKLTSEMSDVNPSNRQFDPSKYHISKNEDIAIHNDELTAKSSSKATPSTERFRQEMYDEYMVQIAKRQDRQQNKVIKISSHQIQSPPEKRTDEKLEVTHVKGIEDEFMCKVKQLKQKYGFNSEDTDYASLEKSDAEDSEPVLVMDGDHLSDAKKLPKHLKEFVDITRQAAGALDKDTEDGIWSPGQRDFSSPEGLQRQNSQDQERGGEALPPVWTPKSAGSSPSLERKEFRPVNFESPILGRRNKSDGSADSTPIDPPWRSPIGSSDIGVALSSSLEKRIPNSFSSPISGFSDFPSPRLPKAQNPTITLLQKARGGHLPKGAAYIDQIDGTNHHLRHDSPPKLAPGEIVYEIKNEYTSESEGDRPKKMADLSQRKYTAGIGPTTKDGMPLTLRSEVRDQNQSKWYKRMYDTIHKQKPRYDDEFVTVRYKQRRGRYPYGSGYLSEPEPGAYDSDASIYDHRITPLDRRRTQPAASGGGESYTTTSYTMPRSSTNSYAPPSTIVRHGKDVYKNQPGRIENYVPGHSSISDKEAKEWWDEVMDIFDGHLEQQKQVPGKGYLSQALKESGYESDSTLIFRRRDENINQLSPSEQREAYRTIQKGGDVPLHGLRKLAPERPKEPDVPIPPPKGLSRKAMEPESPRKYVENEVTIHYRTPVRQEIKEALSEDELQRRQAEHMKKIYQEERRRKYLQVSHSLDELQDMNSRRHADNFIPSQKSPIPLNRYDDFVDDFSPKLKPRPRSPEPRLVAKALYNFVGQSARELTFRKGDIIYIRRQVDKNWYEGEHNAMVGLFPANYVEIVPYDGIKSTVRKPHEGQARAKYNFIAQTHLELSLAKGELVVITRRVDDNWFEGKIGGRKGIFPVSYVEVLIDPSDPPQVPPSAKPAAAPAAHSLLLNGSLGGKESMGSHKYVPPPFQSGNESTPSYRAKPVQMSGGGTYGSLSRSKNLNQALHIDTQSDPIPYRALYKYKPQNEDELELLEGDTVYVLEKCDDGWFVGSSDRTGAFGTFPGNYVERI